MTNNDIVEKVFGFNNYFAKPIVFQPWDLLEAALFKYQNWHFILEKTNKYTIVQIVINDNACIAMRKGKNLFKIITQVVCDAFRESGRLNEMRLSSNNSIKS